jgi:hypothetical protein
MNSEFAPRFKFQDFSGGVEVALTSDQVKQIKFDEVKADQNLHTGYCFRGEGNCGFRNKFDLFC